jgi:hypothetical protein
MVYDIITFNRNELNDSLIDLKDFLNDNEHTPMKIIKIEFLKHGTTGWNYAQYKIVVVYQK